MTTLAQENNGIPLLDDEFDGETETHFGLLLETHSETHEEVEE